MRITYDPEVDALYIELRPDVQAHHGIDIEAGVTADVDADGHIIGVEVLDAKERLGDPTSVTFEWLAGKDEADEEPRADKTEAGAPTKV